MPAHDHAEIALRYLAAIEAGASGAELARFLDPDIEQREFPNRLTPAGATRDFAALSLAAERGKMAVRDQRYAVRNLVAQGDEVAIEVDWSATLNIALGQSPAGTVMRADFAVFLTFREGLIVAQRNYDCFHAF